ncbi:hypothetical protein EYF80_004616 [Liparis tanakae]|uniref:Uncharacterized protein n=1 Tax=Liparis tanakae TaxID=230148 RepID=A0A4Z2J519_9TELE|nr:hypothetical protein EYF80_004616 [Liparis tanakae]
MPNDKQPCPWEAILLSLREVKQGKTFMVPKASILMTLVIPKPFLNSGVCYQSSQKQVTSTQTLVCRTTDPSSKEKLGRDSMLGGEMEEGMRTRKWVGTQESASPKKRPTKISCHTKKEK